jgi:hypothetical protein
MNTNNTDVTAPNIPRVVKTQPGNGVILSKLNNDSSKKTSIKQAMIGVPSVANDIRERIKNNEDIIQLFPDVELAIQILTSSILAPNDMLTTSLVYVPPEIKLPVDVKSTIMDIIKKHITTNYNIEDKLTEILREALFTKGAYIEAIIPEASVDDIINNNDGQISLESFLDKSLEDSVSNNFLLKGVETDTEISLESLAKNSTAKIKVSFEDLGLDITDDINILSIKRRYEHALSKVIKDKFSRRKSKVSTEAKKINLDDLFRNNANTKMVELEYVPTSSEASRQSIGMPLVMKLPVDSVIPVHVKSDVKKHLGYFVLLDENGAPIDLDYELNKVDTATNSLYASADNKVNLINKAKTALQGITKNDVKLENLETVYNELVDKAIKSRLKNGMYGDLADIRDSADVYRVMFMRALRSKKTRVLFLPSELVAFYAFDYRDNGTGKSLLEKVSMLFSIRSILLFAKIMATVKNSTSVTKVTAHLDDDDNDPEATMEKIMSEALKTRQTQVPLGVIKIDDLVDWSQKVGFSFNFSGANLPDMTIDVADETSQKQVPDQDLDTMIQDHIIMSFGLTPEIVQAGYSADFATTVMAKNLLFAKRVMQTQHTLLPQASSHIRKYMSADMLLQNKIRGVIEDNITSISSDLKKYINSNNDNDIEAELLNNKEALIDYILDAVIDETSVEIPMAELSEAQSMKDSFEAYKTVVETYIDLIISAEAMPSDIFGDMSDQLDNIKAIVKTVLYKKWMADNNYLPEISEFLTRNEDGKPTFNLLEEYSVHATNLAEAILPFIKVNNKFKDKYNDKLSKLAIPPEGDDFGGDETSPDDADAPDDGTEQPTDDDLGGYDNTDDAGDDANIPTGDEELPTEDDKTSTDDISGDDLFK